MKLILGTLVVALVLAPLSAARTRNTSDRQEKVRWRQSTAVGVPHAGRLVNGVRLPAEGRHFFTWDPVLKQAPNRAWRRWGTDRLVRRVLRVVAAYADANPRAPRIGIGDLSRPEGGDFGVGYGRPGHVSHQNGLDVDVYYPRKDRRERPPTSPRQIDHALSQDLLDRFLNTGPQIVFVGPRTNLRGRRTQPLAHHDNHMHVRIRFAKTQTRRVLGRSSRGRPIAAWRLGGSRRGPVVLVVGCIHGDECAGMAVTKRLVERAAPRRGTLWVVHDVNPDGRAMGVRQNGRGVDLNRNFPSAWRATGRPWDPQYPGRHPLSEPESRIIRSLVMRLRPRVTIWFHQPQGLVRAWGGSIEAARRYAKVSGVPFTAIRWPAGTAPNWQNHRFPHTSSFVVELPAGRLSAVDTARHARAVLALSG